MIRVGLHPYLDEQLNTSQQTQLRSEFVRWKSNGEDSSYVFGRDSAYDMPRVHGARRLRHVHLAPSEDPKALAQWKKEWDRSSPRTSDKVLVYVWDGSEQSPTYLLIAVLPQGRAHAIAKMETPEHATLMRAFARIAEHFFDTGTILKDPAV